MKKNLLLLLLMCFPLLVSADAVEVDGIYYNLNSSEKTAEVTNSPTYYSGEIVIPQTIIVDNITYDVTAIKDRSFRDCNSLTSIVIPNSIVSVGEYCFTRCKALKTIIIPSSLTSIGHSVFYMCDLENIMVESGNPKYDSRDNCNAIIETATNTLYIGCKNTIIPQSVTSIGDFAFNECENLTSIIIPNSVTSIGTAAFQKCISLSSVEIPNNVFSIGSSAFNICSSLQSVTLPASLKYISNGAFSYCNNLTSIIAKIKKPIEIQENVFTSTTYTNATLTVPKGKKEQFQSVAYWSSFTNIVESDEEEPVIGETIRTIHVETAGTLPQLITADEKNIIEELTLTGELNGTDFRLIRDMAGCDYLGNLTGGSLVVLDLSGAKIVEGGEKYLDTNKIQVTQGMSIGNTFSFNTQTDVVGNYLFCGCYLNSIILPNSVTSIAPEAFEYCRFLTSVNIPNSVTSIGSWAFSECNSLQSITIPASVTSIGMRAFLKCNNLESINVETGNEYFTSENGVLFDNEVKTLLYYPLGNSSTTYVVPSTVTSINELAFSYCKALTSITLPDNLTNIGYGAFMGCSSLASINLPNTLTAIGQGILRGCESLSSITIPESVKSIGEWAFMGCESLAAISIPSSVTSIGGYAFNSQNLMTVTSHIKNPFPIEKNVFSDATYANGTIRVPVGSCSAYQATDYWSSFENVLEEENNVYSIPEAIDLGLTSGTLWASCNIGASSPEEYGDYFAWGETVPKENYDWSTYKFGGESNFSKYNSIDGLTELELEDDAAYVILGKGWRMPTHEEELELVNECTWENDMINGVSGYRITGPNGNSIFMPRGGIYDGTDYACDGTILTDVNTCGWYWSSTLNAIGSSYAQGLCFFPSLLTNVSDHERCDGHNIRPVYEKKDDVADVVDLGLSVKWASWNVGANKPEGLGDLYAWGELTPKTNYSTSTYKFYDGGYTKYGSVDNKYRLDSEDDVAQQTWGNRWRIPTFEEFEELKERCTFTKTELNGVPVTKVTGPNGNFIYFPYPGNYTGTTLYFENSIGSYWSSDLETDSYAKDLDYISGTPSLNGDSRYHGQSIRPVFVENMTIKTLIFDTSSQPMLVGGHINNYSKQDVSKKGIIVSKNIDDMFITEDTKYYKAEIIGSDCYEGVSWVDFDQNAFDIKFIDCTSTNEEQFAYALQFLMGNTDYYVKAFVIDAENNIIYGNVEKVHTMDFNRCNGAHDYANVWHAFDYTLFDLVTDEIIDPNNGFYYSTNENPTNVSFWTGTGYNTCYKYITEWNYRLWYYQQWNRDDWDKGNNYSPTHIPVMKYDNGKLTIEKNPLDADKDITIYYSINGNYFRPEYYTNIYEQPLELTEPCTVYCYAISADGSISYTNLYSIGIANNLIMGDANGDGEVNVGDIMSIINMIVGTSETSPFADMNGDGEVNVGDIMAIVNIIIANANTNANGNSRVMSRMDVTNSDFLTVTAKNSSVGLALDNQLTYGAFQMKVAVPKDASITSVNFNSDRLDGFSKLVRKLDDGQYLIMGYSMDGDIVSGSDGEIMEIKTSDGSINDVIVSDVIFSTPTAVTYHLPVISNGSTSINNIIEGKMRLEGNTLYISASSAQTINVYSFNGSLYTTIHLHPGQNTITLPQGLYIINHKKIIIK